MNVSLWPRERSRGLRPAAVRRYSVLGVRPSKYFLQTTYCASSNLRACTLRFPSVVFRSCLRSLKVSESLTASALMMASRMRSCMSRSSSAACAGPSAAFGPRRCSLKSCCWLCAPAFDLLRSFVSAFCLATVVPRNVESEDDVQQAEAPRQEVRNPRAVEDDRQERADEHRRRKVDDQFSCGS